MSNSPTPLQNELAPEFQYIQYRIIHEWIRLVFCLESFYNLQLLIWSCWLNPEPYYAKTLLEIQLCSFLCLC